MEQIDETATLNKGGETVVEVRFRRNVAGLLINARTVRAIEDFMQGLGDGSTVDVRTAGRLWVPTTSTPLMAYSMSNGFPGEHNNIFRLDQLGRNIIVASREGEPFLSSTNEPVANLSFLRLVGISEGAGVQFGVKGVYSLDTVVTMRDQVIEASRRLYIAYLKPIDFCVQVNVSTQEIPTR